MPKPPLETALAELARRDLSLAELHNLLARKGFLPAETEEALAQILNWNLASDERAATARLDRRTGRNARGDAALLNELLEKGIPEALAQRLVARRSEETPERDRAIALLKTKYPRGAERAKAARFLASRGFDEETIETALETLPNETEPS